MSWRPQTEKKDQIVRILLQLVGDTCLVTSDVKKMSNILLQPAGNTDCRLGDVGRENNEQNDSYLTAATSHLKNTTKHSASFLQPPRNTDADMVLTESNYLR